jgi:hypothetical protein
LKNDKHEERRPRCYGLLALLEPGYEHLLDAEARFERALNRAAAEGRLFIPDEFVLQ